MSISQQRTVFLVILLASPLASFCSEIGSYLNISRLLLGQNSSSIDKKGDASCPPSPPVPLVLPQIVRQNKIIHGLGIIPVLAGWVVSRRHPFFIPPVSWVFHLWVTWSLPTSPGGEFVCCLNCASSFLSLNSLPKRMRKIKALIPHTPLVCTDEIRLADSHCLSTW